PDVGGTPVRVVVAGRRERGHRHRRGFGEPAPVLVVDVNHAYDRRHEQRRLGPEVVLQVGVEVQVVLRQVGEDGHVEAGATDPAQGQRVTRYLHRGGGYPALHHDREQRLQVGCLGRGQRAGQTFL